jgi:4-amino-4-deoxy-L-arabinose transferase-like glycosyltransferase
MQTFRGLNNYKQQDFFINMTKKAVAFLKGIEIHTWILILVVAAGVFLRTYHFHDWLQFSPDQARDATIISDAVSGKTSLPLLGPVAGGTYFQLGPAFYYFGYVVAFIFGNTPDKMAYPDLLFGILTIPLFYFFLKKYFSINLSLALVGLFSISFFAVKYSRFSWNPNLVPFFVLLFLYSLLEILNGKKKTTWPILAGVALGIGIQLHSLLLVMMPITVVLLVAYLFFQKKLIWKSFLIILFVSVFLNVPQVISEVRNNGGNIRNFFSAANEQSDSRREIISAAGVISSCQIIYNAHMLSSFENKENCENIFASGEKIKDFNNFPGNFTDSNFFMTSIILSILFSLGGYFLWGYYWRKEKDENKKNFLGILILFHVVAFGFFLPVASRLSIRYYIILFVIPFVLGGFWARFILEKIGKRAIFVLTIIMCILVFSNLFVISQAATPFLSGRGSDKNNSILGEIEPVANYITDKAKPHDTAYIVGERMYLERFSSSLEYLVRENNLNLFVPFETDVLDPDTPLFYIARTTRKEYKPGMEMKEKMIKDVGKFGTITMFLLNNQ